MTPSTSNCCSRVGQGFVCATSVERSTIALELVAAVAVNKKATITIKAHEEFRSVFILAAPRLSVARTGQLCSKAAAPGSRLLRLLMTKDRRFEWRLSCSLPQKLFVDNNRKARDFVREKPLQSLGSRAVRNREW